MKKCIVHQNVPGYISDWCDFPGMMKNGFIYAMVPDDSELLKGEDLQQVAPVAVEAGCHLYNLEAYLFATETSREWYNIMLYDVDQRYGYVETKTGKVLTTPRFTEIGIFGDKDERVLAIDEFEQAWMVDRNGNMEKYEDFRKAHKW